MDGMRHWHLSAPASTILIDSEELLEQYAHVLHGSAVVGIDAEWPPEQTGNAPTATLLQLACWSQHHGLTILIIDLLGVNPEATCLALQPFFRSQSILKVGYALGGDLAALSRALGDRGQGCVAVISPVVDIRALHRALRWHTPQISGIHRAHSEGLSGIVEAQLGAPLDKQEQCSAWGERPLRESQILYAATDACCLLAVLDACLACCAPMLGPGGCWGLLSSTSQASTQSADKEERTDEENEKERGISLGPFRWTHDQLEAASKAWGQRWECSGGKKEKIKRTGGLPSSSLNNNNNHTLSKKNRKLGNDNSTAATPRGILPPHIPWMDASRRLLSPPRFLADVMVQGLARQLRLWGVDAEAVDTVPKGQRHVVHRSLVERSETEGRVILTRDSLFMHRRLSDQAYYVTSEAKKEQLEEIIEAFSLPVEREALLSRCSRCNGELFMEPVAPENLPPGHGVPQGVLDRVEEFWVCSRCHGAYWQGSMYENAMERLSAQLESMMKVSSSKTMGCGSAPALAPS